MAQVARVAAKRDAKVSSVFAKSVEKWLVKETDVDQSKVTSDSILNDFNAIKERALRSVVAGMNVYCGKDEAAETCPNLMPPVLLYSAFPYMKTFCCALYVRKASGVDDTSELLTKAIAYMRTQGSVREAILADYIVHGRWITAQDKWTMVGALLYGLDYASIGKDQRAFKKRLRTLSLLINTAVPEELIVFESTHSIYWNEFCTNANEAVHILAHHSLDKDYVAKMVHYLHRMASVLGEAAFEKGLARMPVPVAHAALVNYYLFFVMAVRADPEAPETESLETYLSTTSSCFEYLYTKTCHSRKHAPPADAFYLDRLQGVDRATWGQLPPVSQRFLVHAASCGARYVTRADFQAYHASGDSFFSGHRSKTITYDADDLARFSGTLFEAIETQYQTDLHNGGVTPITSEQYAMRSFGRMPGMPLCHFEKSGVRAKGPSQATSVDLFSLLSSKIQNRRENLNESDESGDESNIDVDNDDDDWEDADTSVEPQGPTEEEKRQEALKREEEKKASIERFKKNQAALSSLLGGRNQTNSTIGVGEEQQKSPKVEEQKKETISAFDENRAAPEENLFPLPPLSKAVVDGETNAETPDDSDTPPELPLRDYLLDQTEASDPIPPLVLPRDYLLDSAEAYGPSPELPYREPLPLQTKDDDNSTVPPPQPPSASPQPTFAQNDKKKRAPPVKTETKKEAAEEPPQRPAPPPPLSPEEPVSERKKRAPPVKTETKKEAVEETQQRPVPPPPAPLSSQEPVSERKKRAPPVKKETKKKAAREKKDEEPLAPPPDFSGFSPALSAEEEKEEQKTQREISFSERNPNEEYYFNGRILGIQLSREFFDTIIDRPVPELESFKRVARYVNDYVLKIKPVRYMRNKNKRRYNSRTGEFEAFETYYERERLHNGRAVEQMKPFARRQCVWLSQMDTPEEVRDKMINELNNIFKLLDANLKRPGTNLEEVWSSVTAAMTPSEKRHFKDAMTFVAVLVKSPNFKQAAMIAHGMSGAVFKQRAARANSHWDATMAAFDAAAFRGRHDRKHAVPAKASASRAHLMPVPIVSTPRDLKKLGPVGKRARDALLDTLKNDSFVHSGTAERSRAIIRFLISALAIESKKYTLVLDRLVPIGFDDAYLELEPVAALLKDEELWRVFVLENSIDLERSARANAPITGLGWPVPKQARWYPGAHAEEHRDGNWRAPSANVMANFPLLL